MASLLLQASVLARPTEDGPLAEVGCGSLGNMFWARDPQSQVSRWQGPCRWEQRAGIRVKVGERPGKAGGASTKDGEGWLGTC